MSRGGILSKDALAKAWDPERPLPVLFFPDSGGSCEGEPGPACLSQWGSFPFEHEGLRFPTAEHWMMHGKARLFRDEDMGQAILKCRTSWQAKEYGRRVRGFDPALWEERAQEIVTQGNLLKFRQHPRFGEWLVSTAPAVLAEASPTDEVWGIGLSEADRAAGDPRRWPGRNLLGFALMRVREILVGTSRSGWRSPGLKDLPSSLSEEVAMELDTHRESTTNCAARSYSRLV